MAPFFEVEDFETFKKGGRRWKMKICLPPFETTINTVLFTQLMEDGREFASKKSMRTYINDLCSLFGASDDKLQAFNKKHAQTA